MVVAERSGGREDKGVEGRMGMGPKKPAVKVRLTPPPSIPTSLDFLPHGPSFLLRLSSRCLSCSVPSF